MCRITKSVVADVFSRVKIVEYVSAQAAGTPLPGAYSAPQTPNWTKGEWKEKEGKGGEDGNGKRGEGGKHVRDIGERREREKEGEKERREVCRQLQLLHPPVFAKQFHTVKAVEHRVRGCLSFACGEILGWVIPRTPSGVSVDGRTGG